MQDFVHFFEGRSVNDFIAVYPMLRTGSYDGL